MLKNSALHKHAEVINIYTKQ